MADKNTVGPGVHKVEKIVFGSILIVTFATFRNSEKVNNVC